MAIVVKASGRKCAAYSLNKCNSRYNHIFAILFNNNMQVNICFSAVMMGDLRNGLAIQCYL